VNASDPIYWVHFSTYEQCPQLFLWDFGWDGVDLGQGPGKPKKFEGFVDSRHRQVMGTVIGKAIEKLYAEEAYKNPGGPLEVLEPFVEREWVRQALKESNPISYEKAGKSAEELIEECKKGVRGYLQTMRQHRLLGPFTKAEFWMSGKLNRWLDVAGIADLLVKREDTGVTILDFKDTPHKMKFTDPDQIRWYGLVFWRAYGQLPDRLGFVWLRFPAGMKTRAANGALSEESGIEWVSFDQQDLLGLAGRAVAVRDGMRQLKFEALPEPGTCKRCRWEPVCPERQAQRDRNAIRRRKPGVEGPEGEDGFVDFEP
jgi:hypothetical protein